VFWRETGMKDDDDDVDAREGACSIETAMLASLGKRAVQGAQVLCARRAVVSGRCSAGVRPARRQAGEFARRVVGG
jgi:hypothetical protein